MVSEGNWRHMKALGKQSRHGERSDPAFCILDNIFLITTLNYLRKECNAAKIPLHHYCPDHCMRH